MDPTLSRKFLANLQICNALSYWGDQGKENGSNSIRSPGKAAELHNSALQKTSGFEFIRALFHDERNPQRSGNSWLSNIRLNRALGPPCGWANRVSKHQGIVCKGCSLF